MSDTHKEYEFFKSKAADKIIEALEVFTGEHKEDWKKVHADMAFDCLNLVENTIRGYGEEK